MLATYHQNSVSAVFSLKYSCWELKGWGLFICKPSPPQVTTARQLIRETPSLMMDASSSSLDPKHISPKNHPETMEKTYGWQLEVQWTTGYLIPTCPPPGWWPPWPPRRTALQPKDLVEAVHPSSWKHPAHTSVFCFGSLKSLATSESSELRKAKELVLGLAPQWRIGSMMDTPKVCIYCKHLAKPNDGARMRSTWYINSQTNSGRF